ncbi:MAG: LysR family transcriptional regulator [Legionellales bacterium]|nr:LysR family transcriptional regulator [Legionellales bacterium]
MNIRDLKYLIAVAQHQHFGKAAKMCCVSQPTLSAQVKKLEEELGVVIFERTNKSVMITPIGKKIIQQAITTLHNVELLYQLAQQNHDPLAGRLDIGIIPTLGPYVLPHVVPGWREQLPKLSIHLHEDKTDVIVKALQQGELDAIILALPVPNEHCTTQFLFTENFYVALPKDHRLAVQAILTPQDLENETLLLLAEGHCFRDQALAVCHHVGIKREAGLQATSLETLRQMVALGAGITLLPKLALPTDSQHHEAVVIKPFNSPSATRSVGMLWREQSPRHQACVEVARICQEIIAPVIANDFYN